MRAYRPHPERIFRIGRDAACDLYLSDPTVSRIHATVEFQTSTGQWIFRNVSSTSGSWMGERKIDEHTLADGASIQIGIQVLRFLLQEQELTVLHAENGSEAVTLPWNGQTAILMGRAPGTPLRIEHPACPNRLARIRPLPQGCVVHFERRGEIAHGRKRKKIRMSHGDWLRLPWGTLQCDSHGLVWHPRPVGLSVHMDNLCITKGSHKLLDGISLTLPPGSLLAVIGMSGQGKSTLLGAMTSARPATEGRITFDGIDHVHPGMQSQVAFLPQHPAMRPFLSVQETLQAAAHLHLPADHAPAEIATRIADILSLVNLEHRRETRVAVLSGGEQRRLALAARLLAEPGLLLLDEPLSGLDPVHAKRLCDHLRQLAWLGHTIVLTTHSYEALEAADHVLVLHQGAQAFFGKPADAYRFFNVQNATALLARLGHRSGGDWSTLYRRSTFHDKSTIGMAQTSSREMPVYFPAIRRHSTLMRTLSLEFRQWTRDKGRLAAVLLQPLLIGGLLHQVFRPGASLWAAAFALLLCANWFAFSLAIRAFVAERELLADEVRYHLQATSLLAAKSLLPLVIAFAQTLLCWALFMPSLTEGTPLGWLAAILGVCIAPAISVGLLASLASRTAGQANALLPLLLIPQAALAGALAPVDQMGPVGSALAESLWSSHVQSMLQNLFTATLPALSSFTVPVATACGIFIINRYLLTRLRSHP